jgi:hypothetical protein
MGDWVASLHTLIVAFGNELIAARQNGTNWQAAR